MASQQQNTAETPLVSILVPVFNVQKYLGTCLDSLCAQTYDNLQIICINDGSTDESLNILQDYAACDSRIQIIDKPNSGYGDSMNKGLAAAQGTYVGIVESDDFIDSDMYEAYVRAAQEFDADIVKSNYYQFEQTPDGGAPQNQLLSLYETAGIPTGKPIDPCDHLALFTVRPSIWSALYKREFLTGNNISFATTPGAAFQDTSFYQLCMLHARRVVLLNEGWLHYRLDSAGSSSNSGDKIFLVCNEFDRALAVLKDQIAQAGQAPAAAEKTAALRSIAGALGAARMSSYMWNMNRIAPEHRLEFALRWQLELMELNREAFVDYSLLRADSCELLALLAEDPQAFVDTCNEAEHWMPYAYEPYERVSIAQRAFNKVRAIKHRAAVAANAARRG